jgi:polysaccharide pyruvyl transferase WcaK-like protein
MRRMRIAFYGNFGDGNLGNECTLQTVIDHTLERWPDARLECICTGPEDVRTRHGIEAFGCRVSRKRWARQVQSADSGADRGSTPGPGDSLAGRSLRGVISGWRRLMREQREARTVAFRLAARSVRILRLGFWKLPLECAHWARSLRVLATADMLIVPGTGIATDKGCGPWGWPYELFKYSALAALCRVRLAYLSIGAGPIDHPLSRWFVAKGLALADYRSYRDEESRRFMHGRGLDTGGDAVYPDLVFGLGVRNLSPGGPRDASGRVVGLGLKDYSASGDASDDSGYREYLELMAGFVSWLGRRGYAVRLLIGDMQYDSRVRHDLLDLLASRSAPCELPRVVSQSVTDVRELIRQLAETDIVISPRLHNLILALMLERPVIALCDLPKVRALLSELQLAEYCLPIESLDVERLAGRFLQLENEMGRLKIHIRERVESYRHRVEEQYAAVLGSATEAPVGNMSSWAGARSGDK